MSLDMKAAAHDDCECGHGRWSHKRGSGACGEWPCRCDRYERKGEA